MAETFRAVQPMHWAGMTKVQGGPMVCGACPTPEACDAANRCARASDEDYERGYLPLNRSRAELDAIEHVRERIAEDGSHDVTGCPKYCRMMCPHRITIKALIDRDAWPLDLA